MRLGKTVAGAVVVALAAAVRAKWPEYGEVADAVHGAGLALIAVGIGHKLDKGPVWPKLKAKGTGSGPANGPPPGGAAE